VPTDHWAYKYVEYAASRHIVGGYANGYHPTEEVSRAAMAVYVARAVVTPTGDEGLAGYTPPSIATFQDVPVTGYGESGLDPYWAYKWIEYCRSQNIVGGYANGYHPEEIVTKAQMAMYVAKAFQLPM
jgi:hypothetical protein